MRAWRRVEKLLTSEGRLDVLEQLTADRDDDDRWIRVGTPDIVWKRWYRGKPANDIVAQVGPLWSLDRQERQALVENEWTQLYRAPIIAELADLFYQYCSCREQLDAIYQRSKTAILRDCRVIGATTSGAAVMFEMIEAAEPDIVLFEEAGEILEAHVIATLPRSIKQLVLIGDHQQLRPKVAEYRMTSVSRGPFSLDVSLFERLIVQGMHSYVTLAVQRRMRPEISCLIKPFYPALTDHADVSGRPDISVVLKNVIFWDHRIPENDMAALMSETPLASAKVSKRNLHEARLAIELARLLIFGGGYVRDMSGKTDDLGITSVPAITILTPYLGQLVVLRDLVRECFGELQALMNERDLEDLRSSGLLPKDEYCIETRDVSGVPAEASSRQQKRCLLFVSTVDNYQGNEADIIIVSLVRSNIDGSIGFLKEAERVTVLLSRARMAMYLIGNSETFRSHSLWDGTIFPILDASHAVLDYIPSVCTKHGVYEALRTPEDFRLRRPNGGCLSICGARLECGHVCKLLCHSIAHEYVPCDQPCTRPCRLGHPCTKLCGQPCGPCREPCIVMLPCGHEEQTTCVLQQRNEVKCSSTVQYENPHCHHVYQTTCSIASGPAVPRCIQLCEARLVCGHPCGNTCLQCKALGKHAERCEMPCEKYLVCGHACQGTHCPNAACPSCDEPCFTACEHSKCNMTCSLPCSICLEGCSWECEHRGACEHECGVPCDRLPCDLRCNELLKCGHQCISVCGERCPLICQICESDETIRSQVVDLLTFGTFQQQNLDSDAVLALGCGHLLCMSTKDGLFEMDTFYARVGNGGDGPWVRALMPDSGVNRPVPCPQCRELISRKSLKRYGRSMNARNWEALKFKYGNFVRGRCREAQQESNVAVGCKGLVKLWEETKNSRKNPFVRAAAVMGKFIGAPDATRYNAGCLVEIGMTLALRAASLNNTQGTMFTSALNLVYECIVLADTLTWIRHGVDLRVRWARLVECRQDEVRRERARRELDWVIQHSDNVTVSLDDRNEAKRLAEFLRVHTPEQQ